MNRKIKLLGIAPYRFLPAVNGGHKAIGQFYQHISQYAETVVVSTKNNNEALSTSYQLIQLFSSHPFHYINVFYFFSIKRLIKQNNTTHVMIEHPYTAWLGFLLKKMTGIKWMIRSHNIEAVRFKTLGKWWWKAMWLYERWAHQKADMSFFITEADRQFAIEQYHLSPHKCDVLTYGINQQSSPSPQEKNEAKEKVCRQYKIPLSNTLLLFLGDLNYAPNTLAVEAIVNEINPLLLQHSSFSYTLFICGKSLPERLQKLITTKSSNIIYTGFVDDISLYFLAAGIFINPVIAGGGIKTKLVEALSYNCNAVSTVSGAAGISQNLTNHKLKIVADNDWEAFASAVLNHQTTESIPSHFYDYFYWGNIARKAVNTMLFLSAK